MTIQSQPSAPQLGLLGLASLRPGSADRFAGSERLLERKAAGLLAYLALDGRTPRSTLAGLLWPDVPERSARSNLRQTLYRLRRLDPGLVQGENHLLLGPHLSVDVARLELAAFAGHDAEVLAFPGELLEDHDYDDCPEFMEWLLVQRERLHTRRAQAHARRSSGAEAAGDLEEALRHAEQLLALDPVSEVSHRLLMRLHARRGDRGAALLAYGRCRATLRRELDVDPAPETRELARQLQRDALWPEVRLGAEAAPPAPPQLAAPPLVGREAEWARLHAAWAAGQTLLVSGPPGVGKTRLLHDFMAAHGPLHVFQGRPGDEAVPYLSLARAFRHLLPLLPQELPGGWVRTELSRLLPELSDPVGDGPERAAPEQAEPLHFLEACHQFCDEASRQVWLYALTQPALTNLGLRVGLTYRPDEVSPAHLEALERLTGAGAATRVELAPLNAAGVEALLGGVLGQVPPGLAPALGRHTGGNPLFLLETLRSLSESGTLESASAGPLPLPARLGSLIARRLERLSPEAVRVARVGAVAGTDLTPELTAAVLEVHPLDLARPWAELEAAQIMHGAAFAHDLLAEAARASLPAPIRSVLHGRVALALERPDARPEAARVAHHWQEAGEPQRAAPWWVQAGWIFLGRGAWDGAQVAFARAMEALPFSHPAHQDALYGLGRALLGSQPEQAERHLLAALSAGPLRRRETELRAALSALYRLQGRLTEGGEQIRQAIERVPDDAGGTERSRLWRGRFWIELRSGRLPEAEEAIRQARRLAPHDHWVADEHALLLWHSGRFQEAAQMYETLARLRREHGEPEEDSRAAFGSNRAWTFWALARNAEAEALLGRPYQPAGSPFEEALRQANRGTVLTSLGRSADALAALAQAEPVMRAYPLHHVDVLHRRSVVYHRADRHAEALPLLQEGLPLARRVNDPYRLAFTLASAGAALAHLNDPAAARLHAAEALAVAEGIRFPLTLAVAHQSVSLVARLDGRQQEAARHAAQAAAVARACDLTEQLGQARLLEGLTLNEPAPLREALQLGQQYGLPDLVWRSASALTAHEDGHGAAAGQARAHLRRLAPPGWF